MNFFDIICEQQINNTYTTTFTPMNLQKLEAEYPIAYDKSGVMGKNSSMLKLEKPPGESLVGFPPLKVHDQKILISHEFLHSFLFP